MKRNEEYLMEIDLNELVKFVPRSEVKDFSLYPSVYRIVSEFKLKEVLELGTGLGESGLAFMSAGAKLTTVDFDKRASERAFTIYSYFGFTPYKIITADDRISNFIEDRKWDAIFIDTSHMYEHTKLELEYCCTRTNCILMDDFWWGDETDRGVKGAVEDFLRSHPEWKSDKPEWSRVGILSK
jgi:predicted O-methyltransferase YrrM